MTTRLREWKSVIPNSSDRSTPLTSDALTKFFETSYELASIDVERRQSVISALASQGGLRLIRELIAEFVSKSEGVEAITSALQSL